MKSECISRGISITENKSESYLGPNGEYVENDQLGILCPKIELTTDTPDETDSIPLPNRYLKEENPESETSSVKNCEDKLKRKGNNLANDRQQSPTRLIYYYVTDIFFFKFV